MIESNLDLTQLKIINTFDITADEKLYNIMLNQSNEINLGDDLMLKARAPLDKMLELSQYI